MYLPLYYHVDVFLRRDASKIKTFTTTSTSKTNSKIPVIITSLSVCYELWLIVERKYIRCTALVELYTFIKSKFDKTLVCLLKSYFYLLILI